MTDALAVIEPEDEPSSSGALTLFGTTDPIAVIGHAGRVALALAQVIDKQGLFTVIGTKKHVHVEGWTLLGSMLGVSAQIEWTRKLENGWEARAIAVYNATGATVGAGEAQCLRSEDTWARRADYTLRAMAQTRAVSRAMRGPLGFVVVLAGYASTPADEMPPASEITATAHQIGEDFKRTRAVPPSPLTPASSSAAPSSSTANYADDDAVCPACGRKEALRPVTNPRFCAKANGGCGAPPRGEVLRIISHGEFKAKHS